ncbi:MAG: transcription-repair coupling factor [Rhizobiales bacterium]|nr:transcription-repair coupling factor [Hyphomicrobiales bacterium]MBO6698360.1 transcription-repair coupling factor [Hyphomicrobiales bacterium]MBO6735386.1 transcription-repair coupling factor [Hyphomicrobiales bacterium]MBO6910806.1 transcription-repair coupling factor [Hyphomicrobiales bacterium]MBO6956474.1 transcription-repair coupling factor [Hyphomicrobiales bacterium]
MSSSLYSLPDLHLDEAGTTALSSVPDGLVPLVLAKAAESTGGAILFIARDGPRARTIEEALAFFAPDIDVLNLPPWDCLPYDRVSPSAHVVAKRLSVLAKLGAYCESRAAKPLIVLTTINAAVQKLPTADVLASQALALAPGQSRPMETVLRYLESNGYDRTATVREAGEYAVRGGIVDLFPPGALSPIRLDFFGDTLESIRTFSVETQRSEETRRALELLPMSEVRLTEETIKGFRRAYAMQFGAPSRDDVLYTTISSGRRVQGMEHWLGLFEADLVPLTEHVPGAPVILDHLSGPALSERLETIEDYYQARLEVLERQGEKAGYKPAPPDALYLDEAGFNAALAGRARLDVSPFAEDDVAGRRKIEGQAKQGRSFAAERASADRNVFDAVREHAAAMVKAGKRVAIACWSEGSRDRMAQVLADHDLSNARPIASLSELADGPKALIGLAVLPIEEGFETDSLAVITETDILGERMVRGTTRRTNKDALTEAGTLQPGDLVVHVDHGIGKFAAMKTLDVAGAPVECLELHYAGGDKLFLPVTNIELLTRYGADGSEANLDKLGGGAWQARKAKLKQRIRDMADKLIQIAAQRAMRTAPLIDPPEGLYDEFAARFPYDETEDQLNSINAVMEDLSSGQPMDRLVCGDVGFGKTEVALRAAFMVALSGRQVAIVVPTTLLARQHFATFKDRFRGFPVNVRQASRFVGTKELAETKAGLKDGTVDIVVGTHALLGKSVSFKDLGLLVIDEEQHFGVAHKERLKEMRADVHVLTLSATPIPRTLQLALTGVRELSLIATPPVDRLAVRTFVSPYDPLIIRETLLREHFRGGQSFYVVPRIKDLEEVRRFLEESVPEVKVGIGHGQMSASMLEEVMEGFYDGKFDVLLSTTIVESGLDIPSANTLIVHRADMFGLGQLYQLRGRVGRSKTRAYALFTVPASQKITAVAERRLKVLQSLETLGAGFQLASHDLDIRGAGNLLGEEQSGHIREVGYELYQQMLEEAVASLKDGDSTLEDDGQWSPQITLGTPVMIPEDYVPDLQLRLQLYRRLSALENVDEIDGLGAEMIDRFGPLPSSVEGLLKLVYIKVLCRRAHVEKLDTGPKGAVVAFRQNTFPNPAGLMKFISEQGGQARVKPDHKIVLTRNWAKVDDRVKGAAVLMAKLAKIAEAEEIAA